MAIDAVTRTAGVQQLPSRTLTKQLCTNLCCVEVYLTMLSYPVKLVAVSGREQPVVLKIRRDGLWLYTEHGKVLETCLCHSDTSVCELPDSRADTAYLAVSGGGLLSRCVMAGVALGRLNKMTLVWLQEIQQLPYQHIVKWLPSKMRSRDPGPDDCLDVQVETASGKKDLRMRCQSEPTVHSIIADIRNTVQVALHTADKQ